MMERKVETSIQELNDHRGCETPTIMASAGAAATAGTVNAAAKASSIVATTSAMEEEETYPLQEELDEILEAFYEAFGEDDMKRFQSYVQEVHDYRLAERALRAGAVAPGFDAIDQDGDRVCLQQLLQTGRYVVLYFYRGKWCPHCNATILALQRHLPQIRAAGAELIAVSPMHPDGTIAMATKRLLDFPVLSDVGNALARKYNITFEVPLQYRKQFLAWGDDVPGHSGMHDDYWEIPLPATFVINPAGKIHWAFVDNDQTVRADPMTVVNQIPITVNTPRTQPRTTTTPTSMSLSNLNSSPIIDDSSSSCGDEGRVTPKGIVAVPKNLSSPSSRWLLWQPKRRSNQKQTDNSTRRTLERSNSHDDVIRSSQEQEQQQEEDGKPEKNNASAAMATATKKSRNSNGMESSSSSALPVKTASSSSSSSAPASSLSSWKRWNSSARYNNNNKKQPKQHQQQQQQQQQRGVAASKRYRRGKKKLFGRRHDQEPTEFLSSYF